MEMENILRKILALCMIMGFSRFCKDCPGRQKKLGMTVLKFGILGAGVIGLTTSLELQSQFPNSCVTIYSEKFSPFTTSDVAAGIFRPGTSFSTSSDGLTRQIIADSYEYYDNLRLKEPSEITGISEISGYIFSSKSPSIVRNELIENIVPLYRSAREEELKICPGHWKYGSYFTTILTESNLFLPWCLENFQKRDGKIIRKKINNFRDLEDEHLDVIINCTGLGSKEICKDRKLVPIRGQVLKVSAKWLKNFFYADYDTYVIPGQDSVTLGGCRHYDSYDENISVYDTQAIWERCTSLVPRLKNSTITTQKVGLRPHRDPVRLESEIINLGGNKLKIVHNYGHGGYGVTTAPGSAKHTVHLVKEALRGKSKM